MPSGKDRAYLVFVVLFSAALLVALVAAFVGVRLQSVNFGPVLLIILFILGVILLFMDSISRQRKAVQISSHDRELSEVQRELDKTGRRYKSLLEGAGNAIFVFNVETGKLEETNRRATELLGYTQDEMVMLRGRDLVPEEELDKFISMVLQVRRDGRARSDGITFRRKDGTSLVGEVDARLIDLGDSRLVHVIVRDISFKRHAELEISQRNRELSILNNIFARANQNLQLQTVLDVTLKETLEVFGVEGGVIHLLEPDRSTLRLAATQSISSDLKTRLGNCGLNMGEQCHIVATQHCHTSEDLSATPCTLGKLAASEEWRSAAACPLLANNRLIGIMHILARNSRIFNPEELRFLSTIGNQIGIVIENAVLFDALSAKSEELLRSYRLLERNSHQLALSQNRLRKNLSVVEKANQELERLDRMKNHFLGMVSHEFKTPLTSILSGAEFLMNSREYAETDDYQVLEMIRNGGERLSDIVNDVLKIAKLEARAITFTKSPIHLAEIFSSVVEQLAPVIRERNLRIHVPNLISLPHFSGDRECLEDIFTELLENAVKFTPDGGEVRLATRLADRHLLADKSETLARFHDSFLSLIGDESFLEVEVCDSGIGIDSNEQLKIFDKFYELGDIRHHSSGRHKFLGKGAGLGLAIVKGMVEAHGGMVWVESRDHNSPHGPGSSFFVLIPLEEKLRQPAFPFAKDLSDNHSASSTEDPEF